MSYRGVNRKKKMPDLQEKHFEGNSEIATEKVKDLLTKGNKEAIVETLTRSGWEGQPMPR